MLLKLLCTGETSIMSELKDTTTCPRRRSFKIKPIPNEDFVVWRFEDTIKIDGTWQFLAAREGVLPCAELPTDLDAASNLKTLTLSKFSLVNTESLKMLAEHGYTDFHARHVSRFNDEQPFVYSEQPYTDLDDYTQPTVIRIAYNQGLVFDHQNNIIPARIQLSEFPIILTSEFYELDELQQHLDNIENIHIDDKSLIPLNWTNGTSSRHQKLSKVSWLPTQTEFEQLYASYLEHKVFRKNDFSSNVLRITHDLDLLNIEQFNCRVHEHLKYEDHAMVLEDYPKASKSIRDKYSWDALILAIQRCSFDSAEYILNFDVCFPAEKVNTLQFLDDPENPLEYTPESLEDATQFFKRLNVIQELRELKFTDTEAITFSKIPALEEVLNTGLITTKEELNFLTRNTSTRSHKL